jgi:hypothetical protein
MISFTPLPLLFPLKEHLMPIEQEDEKAPEKF